MLRISRTLNQFAVEIPTLPVDQCHSHAHPIPEGIVEAFIRIAAPQRRVAMHLGYTWYIWKRFCRSHMHLHQLLCPQELNPWGDNQVRNRFISSTAEKSERPEQNQDLRGQSGPSVKNSVIFSGGDSSKNYGADQQRLQILDLHFDKFPTPATFLAGR